MTAILEPQTTQPADTGPAAVRATPLPGPVAPVGTVEPRTVESRTVESRTRRVLTPTRVRLLSVAMIALFQVGVSVQPPADGANPVEPWWGVALNVIIQVGLLAVLAGVLTGRRWAVKAGLVTGASLLTLSVTCPLEGHHVLASWWFVQMAVGIVLTALPAAVLRRTQAGVKAG